VASWRIPPSREAFADPRRAFVSAAMNVVTWDSAPNTTGPETAGVEFIDENGRNVRL
jgi:hypothetical protein